MIQDAMRRHRRAILWCTLLLVIVPFVIWGGYSGMSRQQGHENYGGPLAKVGSKSVDAADFIRTMEQEQMRHRKSGQETTFRDLDADGTAERILRQFEYRALLEQMADDSGLQFDQAFLVERLKKDRSFQNKDGKFDPELWNRYLKQRNQPNWNAIYENVSENLRMAMASNLTSVGARVLDSEVKDAFTRQNTRIRLKYVDISLPVTPSDADIEKYYKDNLAQFMSPEKRSISYVAFPLTPTKPTTVDDVLQRARNGEDFAKLAREYSSGMTAEDGGELGWIQDLPMQPAPRYVIFNAPPGSVTDPVWVGTGYYIYKIEATRSGEYGKEARVREILIKAAMAPEESLKQTKAAENLLAKAKATSLEQAAQEAGVQVQSVGPIDMDAPITAGPLRNDFMAVMRGIYNATAGQLLPDVVSGSNSLYVIKINAIIPSEQQSLDAVRDKVVRVMKMQKTSEPSYKDELDKIVQDIASKAKSLEDVVKARPDLNLTIEETIAFSPTQVVMGGKMPMWNRNDVFEKMSDRNVGAFEGPIEGMGGHAYFTELAEKIGPSQKDWDEKYPKEKTDLRKNLQMQAQYAMGEDYLQYAYLSNLNKIERNDALYNSIIQSRSPKAEEKAEGSTGGEGSAAPEATDVSVPAETSAASSSATPAAS